jgi:hypothetical protein
MYAHLIDVTFKNFDLVQYLTAVQIICPPPLVVKVLFLILCVVSFLSGFAPELPQTNQQQPPC